MMLFSVKMLKKENKIYNFISTIVIITIICIALLDYFNDPNINKLLILNNNKLSEELGGTYSYYSRLFQMYDSFFKGAMILILLIIFISLIIYTCNYYNKTHSNLIGQLKVLGFNNKNIVMYQFIQLSILIIIGYIIGILLSLIIIPIIHFFSYKYLEITQNFFYFNSETYIQSLFIFLILLLTISFLEINYAIKSSIPSLLNKDELNSYKKKGKDLIELNYIYILLFLTGNICIYLGDINQGIIIPVSISTIGLYGIIQKVIPKIINNINLEKFRSEIILITRNYIMNILSMKSIILIYILNIIILSTLILSNFNNKNYSLLFHLIYLLNNIALSFILSNWFGNKFKINKKNYTIVNQLGLDKKTIIKILTKEILLTYLTLIIFGSIFLLSLILRFILENNIVWCMGLLIILEFLIPLIISYNISSFREKRLIKNGYN